MADAASLYDALICASPGFVAHPGLPAFWTDTVLAGLLGALGWIYARPDGAAITGRPIALAAPGRWLHAAVRRPWLQLSLRLFTVGVFLLVIYAGLFGTPLAERNIATVLTWSLWWTGVIVSVWFVGSAWCAICPWDALATWLTRRRLWRRGDETASLGLRVPRWLRSLWPAWWMFVGLTWLELGVGVTTDPRATAMLALLILVLATASLVIFERKAFCHYFCSVGRTLGYYAQISPIALRPIDPAVCARCETLECYHGTADIEPCPTHQVMGRMRENTFCTSCGACAQSCPEGNVFWAARPVGSEVVEAARPRWDGAWFILALVSLTSFHGLTMLPVWEDWMRAATQWFGARGSLTLSFTLGMLASMAVPAALFALAVEATHRLLGRAGEWRRLFATLALSLLPLAFSYHLAHNFNHLVREGRGAGAVLLNPLGIGTLPMSEAEMNLRHLQPLVNQEVLFALQAGLLVFGFWLGMRILVRRLQMQTGGVPTRTLLLPMTLLLLGGSLFNLWMLMQPMVMRM